MNEYIEIAFVRKGRSLKVKRQFPGGSIEFVEPDPIERRVMIGLKANDVITEYRMGRIRQLRDWAPREFKMRLTAEGGTLVLRGHDSESLPEGRYRLSVRVDGAKARVRNPVVTIDEDGYGEAAVDIETDDRSVAVQLPPTDPRIELVLTTSLLDGLDGIAWLGSNDVRPTRKACLLNLLASLRVRPKASAPLIDHVHHVFWATDDRIYARADLALLEQLEDLARDAKKPFYREGTPHAPIHRKLVAQIPPEDQPYFSPDRLLSFRGEGSPSLQIVVAYPTPGHATVYAEFDLDLGNALQDVVGFVIHAGEVLDGKTTNHLDMRRKLAARKAPTRTFLNYTVVA